MKPLGNRNELASTGVTSQDDRMNAALDPGYFKIDERELPDLVRFAAQYSRLITYYNHQGRADGDWAPFLEKDPVVTLYLIRSYGVKNLRKRYMHRFRQLNHSSNYEYRKRTLWKITHDLLNVLRDLQSLFHGVSVFSDFHRHFENVIKFRLSKVLLTVIFIEQQLTRANGGNTVIDYSREFSTEWFVYEMDLEEVLQEDQNEALAQLIRKADEQSYNLFHSLGELQNEAARYLERNVENSGNIKAHISLLLAFFDLYKLAQDKMNTITARHLDHYYSDVLNIRMQQQVHGKAYVVFRLAEGAPPQAMPAGTLLAAGAGMNGEDLLYSLASPLVVNAGTIASVIGIECNHSWTERSLLFDKPFPSKQYCQVGPGVLQPVAKDVITSSQGLGFALSAAILAQPEGDRKFSFLLHFTYDSFRSFIASCRNEINEKKEHENSYEAAKSEEEKINDMLRDSLVITCSSPEGWYTAEPAKVDVIFHPASSQELTINILLETNEPPVAPVADPVYLGAFQQQLPVFRFMLRSDTLASYNHLRHLVIERAEINAEVIGIRQLALRNDFGPLAVDAPFEMFGPIPAVGNSFYIGHPSLLSPLYDLKVTLEWFGLPIVNGGFAEHYKGYEFIKSNSTFKACVSSLRNNRWIPRESRQVMDLFQNVPEGMGPPEAISKITRLNNFDLRSLELDKAMDALPGPGPFPEAGSNGFIRLDLCYPPNAFGHKEYPELVNKAAQEMMKKKRDTVSQPNEPYTPALKSVLLDIKAKQLIDFNDEQSFFYQVYPFGTELSIPAKEKDTKRIVPYYPDGSTLLIGFSGMNENSTLSVLSKFNDVVAAGTENFPATKWSVLNNGRWTELSPSSITSDETGGMRRTGITRFAFGDVAGGSSLYTPGLLWIKIESTNGFPFLALLEDLHTQAAVAVRHSGEPLLDPLEVGTIKTLVNNNAAIEAVMQPYHSAGGRPAESREMWRQRISERLRHRGRALTNWDYEHLTLERFPEVQMVKCFSHTNAKHGNVPGHVLLAVLPAMEGAGDLGRKGRFTQEKLDQIAGWLRSIAPPTVTVNVSNPRYEKIKVKLRVKLRDGFDVNFYIKALNTDIIRFLDPWADGSGLQVKFGVSVSGFTILNFIENLPYVDFVTNFNVFHIVDGNIANPWSLTSGNMEIVPSTPLSILVSDHEHIINMYEDDSSDTGGINEMMIGTDFIMQDDPGKYNRKGINYTRVGKDFIIDGDANTMLPAGNTKFKMKINR